MWRQAKQVVMTYLTHRWGVKGWSYFVVCCSMTLGSLPLVITSRNSRNAIDFSSKAALSLCYATGLLAFCLARMAKWQFAHPRARLTPGFAGPHVAVLAVLLVAGVGMYPLLISWACGFSLLGMPALAAVMVGCLVWGYHRDDWRLMPAPLAVLFSTMTVSGSRFWLVAGTQQQALVHAGLLAAGWGGMLRWLWRLPHLHEEMPEYQLKTVTAGSRLQRRQQGRLAGQRLAFSPLTARLVDRWHDRIGNCPRSSRRRVPWLLRYGFMGTPVGLTTAVRVGSIAAFIRIFAYFMQLGQQNTPIGVSVCLFLPFFSVFMPGDFAGKMMAQRLPRLGGELLRPLSRVQLIDGLFRSLAMDAAVVWFDLCVASTIVFYVAPPGPLEPRTVGMFLLVSIAIQPASFGVALWLCARWGLVGVQLGMFVVTMPAMIVVLVLWWLKRDDWGDGVFVLAALLTALGGAGRRRAPTMANPGTRLSRRPALMRATFGLWPPGQRRICLAGGWRP